MALIVFGETHFSNSQITGQSHISCVVFLWFGIFNKSKVEAGFR